MIVTDGVPTYEVSNTIPEADESRAAEITIVTLGIGDTVNEVQLYMIAGNKSSNVYLVNEFDQLMNNVENVLGSSCQDVQGENIYIYMFLSY